MLHSSSRRIRVGVRGARAFLILAALYNATLGTAPVLAGSWIPKGPQGGLVLSTAVDPTNPLVVYAGTNNGGVYKSTNSGTTWLPKRNGIFAAVETLAVDPTNPNILYAGSRGGGVYKTTDGGSNWSAVNSGLFPPSNLVIHELAILPMAPATIYAATDDGLYKTTNGGGTWVKRLSTPTVQAVAIDPVNPNVVYTGSTGGTTGGCWKSTNGGTSWTSIISGLWNSYVYVLAIDPFNSNNVYIGNSSGIFRSTNAGGTWERTGNLPNTVGGLAVDPANSGTLYAATAGSGVYKSTDGATSWTQVSAGLGNLRVNWVTFAAGSLYAATDDGLFKSIDAATTWTAAQQGLSGFNTYSILFDAANPS